MSVGAIGGGGGLGLGGLGGGGLAAAAGGAKGAGAAGDAGLVADNMMAQALKGKQAKGLPPQGKMPKTLPMPKGLPKTLPSAPKGGDFGRNGALSRGQGFSQKDTFQAAQKKNQPGAGAGAGAAAKPRPPQQQPRAGANPQDQVKKNQPGEGAQRQGPQRDDLMRGQRKGEDDQSRKAQQISRDSAMDQMQRKRMDVDLILQATKQFAQWSREMMDIFKPSR